MDWVSRSIQVGDVRDVRTSEMSEHGCMHHLLHQEARTHNTFAEETSLASGGASGPISRSCPRGTLHGPRPTWLTWCSPTALVELFDLRLMVICYMNLESTTPGVNVPLAGLAQCCGTSLHWTLGLPPLWNHSRGHSKRAYSRVHITASQWTGHLFLLLSCVVLTTNQPSLTWTGLLF